MTQPLTSNPSYGNFFANFLKGLGLNLSAAQQKIDETALADIVHYEGTNTYNNPFNVVYDASRPATKGVANYNSVGVQEYANLQQGLNATVAFFGSGHNPVWNQFLSALQGGSQQDIINGIDAAYQSWGSQGPSVYGASTENRIIASNAGTGTLAAVPKVQSNLDVIGGAIGNTVGDVTGAITAPIDILKALYSDVTSADWWIRVGFVIVGFVILLIAVDKLSDGAISGSSGGDAGGTLDVVVEETQDSADNASRTVRTSGKGLKPGAASKAHRSEAGKHHPLAKGAEEATG